MIPARQHLREGRDAVIAARLQNGPAPANPYSKQSRRHTYWAKGATLAQARIDHLMEIGG